MIKTQFPEYAIRTEADRRAIDLGYFWDETEALKVKTFIESFCPQSKGGWSGPIDLLDFQWRDIIAPFYS